MSYIDREKTLAALDKLCDTVCPYSVIQRSSMCGACTLGGAFDVIEDELPAADVRENVHGEWIDAYDFLQCSVCKSARLRQARTVYGDTFCIFPKTNFCPDCGADMRGEKDV